MEDAERIARLEARVAEQERTLEELDGVVREQWRSIDGLTREVVRLADLVRDLGRREPGAPEPPPPHF